MPQTSVKLFDSQTIQVASASESAYIKFGDITPRKVSLYIEMVMTGSPTGFTLTVELSPDEGQTLITYDKLLTHDGVDAPQASEVYAASADDVISLSPEDAVRYLRVTMSDSGGDASGSAYFTFNIWAVYSY
jgi:hypothetical protein